jgi:hypothetical protein
MRFSSWRFNSLATRSLDREACLFGARRTECAGGTAGRSVSGGAAAPRVSAGGAEGGGAPCWTCARPDAAAANNAAITRTAKTCFMGHTRERALEPASPSRRLRTRSALQHLSTPRCYRWRPLVIKATVSLWSRHCFFAPGPRESTGTNSLRPQSIPVGPLATHPLNSGERAKCVQPLRPPFTEVARSTSRLLSAGTPASSH